MISTCFSCYYYFRLAKTGFDNVLTNDIDKVDMNDSVSSTSSGRSRVKFHSEPRITMNSGLLVEMLTGIYYAM